MRALVALLILAPLVGVAVATDDGRFDPVERRYVGLTTRTPPLGPAVVCDAEGNGIGGACFAAPLPERVVTILVHDDHLPAGIPMPVMMYSYGVDPVPLPIDSSVACAPNHSAMTFVYARYATRIVVAVGPWALGGGVEWPGPACAGVPGTMGTIEMRPYPGS